MKRALLVLALAGVTLVAFGQKREIRTVPAFTGIEASSAFDITVAKGDAESLTVEADDAIMPYIRSEVRNGVLRLYLANNRVRNIKTLKVYLVMQNLRRVSLSGACKLTVNDLFTSDSIKCDCSGASSMTINVHTGWLGVGTSGASFISMKANVTGNAGIDLSGTSKIQGELNVNRLKLSSDGVSSVTLTGSATELKIDVSGTSKVNLGDFTVKTACINASGVGNITVNATDALTVNSSGASFVNYKGSPTIKVNSSGVSRVRKI